MQTDLLQIKIENARSLLSEEARNAIDNVNWKAEIIKMRETKGYSFEQLDNLEIETELLLCGLLNPEDYPKELEARMGLPKEKITELVEEMNKLVFQKIRQEMIKNKNEQTEQPIKTNIVKQEITNTYIPKKENTPTKNQEEIENKKILGNAGIEIMPTKNTAPNIENRPEELISADPIPKKPISITSQKLSDSFQIPTTKTEYSSSPLKDNTSVPKPPVSPTPSKENIPIPPQNTGYKVDPYRAPIE